MKREELFDALQDLDDKKILAARDDVKKKNPVWTRWMALVACAAIIVGVLLGSPILKGGNVEKYPSGIVTVQAKYPEATAVNLSAQQFMESDAHWDWWKTYRELAEASGKLQGDMSYYYMDIMERILISEDDNTVCSPLNTYVAFAMLAEVTDGNSRQQILDMLHITDIETLRENIKTLWEGNYVDTPTLKSLLANSIWLREGVSYDQDTLTRLAHQYYASTFSGDPGSKEMSEALRIWTDKNTGGLLTEYTKDMKLDSSTVMALVSTIYYKAQWVDKFWAQNTKPEAFHGTKGDTTVDMMHLTDTYAVYNADQFISLGLSLTDSGAMYFYLPKDGIDVNALASDPEILQATRFDPDNGSWSSPLVHLSVPKFNVSGKTDLIEILNKLGLTDILDPSLSDFTPLTKEMNDLFLSTANHTAMVEIDEDGVTGAAYTELAIPESAALPDDEIDFVLDRPFMFVVTGSDGSVLFSGIVRNIES